MNRSFPERFSVLFTAIADGLTGLVREMAPAVIFFFLAFLLIFLLFKLFVAQYAVEFSALSKAAVAALILAKVGMLLDWAESGRRFKTHRRAVVISCQTLLYCLVVIVLGVGERIVRSIREAGNIQGGLGRVTANADVDRFLGGALLVSMVVGSYLVVKEITDAMGRRALYKLFFELPTKPGE